jgi:peroxiredoxin
MHLMKNQLFPVTVGSTAPDFQAKELETGQVRSLADYSGKVVLLNLWATDCAPCRVEMPSIEQLQRDYGDKGLKIIAVSEDDFASHDSIAGFVRHMGLTFQILHDSAQKVGQAYQITGYPETFIIGPEGTIRKKWIGAADWNSDGNRALIAQLLGLATPRLTSDTGDAAEPAPLVPETPVGARNGGP